MHYLLNLAIKWKLALGFSIGLISIALIAATAISTMVSLRDTQSSIQDIQLANVIDYMKLETGISRNRVLLNRMLHSRDPAQRQALVRELKAGNRGNDAIMALLAERVKHDPLPQEKFLALQADRDEFIQLRDTRIVPALLAGRQDEADAAFLESLNLYEEIGTHAAELAQLARDNVRDEVKHSIALVQRAVWILGVIGALAVLLSFAAVAALQRAIAVPLTGVAEAAARISEGELDISMPWEYRQDEIGAMARAFSRMTASLRGLADIADHIADGDLTDKVEPRSGRDRLAISFGIMSENLGGLAREMQLGADEVNAATVEILELTREFVVEMADPKQARAFQNSLLRLEETGRRLGTVVGRIRLTGEK